MVASRRIVSHSASTTNTTTQKSWRTRAEHRRPHQWQREADGDGRSVKTLPPDLQALLREAITGLEF